MKLNNIAKCIEFQLRVFLMTILFPIVSLYPSVYDVPKCATSIDADDIDLDGDIDIVVGHKTSWEDSNPTITILRNNGNGEFPLIDSSLVFCGYQENIKVKKIDNDEYPDIVAKSASFLFDVTERYIKVFYNSYGDIDASEDYPLNTDDTIYIADCDDIDNDGDLDICFFSNVGYFWGVMYNDGTGQYSEPVYYDLEFPPVALACGDIDGDNMDDIAVGSGGRFEVFLSTGSGFDRIEIETTIGIGELDICDIDLDGINEIILIDAGFMGAYMKIIFFEMDDYGNLYESYRRDIDESLINFVVTDLNNDNYPEIIYTNYQDIRTFILYNDNGNDFIGPVSYQTYFGDTPEYTKSIKPFAADIDGNGFNDIVALNSSYAYENDVTILFQTEAGDFVQEPQTGIENQVNLVSMTELYQNYPNPFNNETLIAYSLEQDSYVEISIFNSKGEFVQNLVSSKLNKGKHSFSFNADNINSGLYFYRLSVDGVAKETKKMLYLK